MVFIKGKTISGKKYYYLTKSVRLPDGSVRTIQKIVKNKSADVKDFAEWLDAEEKKMFGKWAVKQYGTDTVFERLQLKKIEEIRLDYKMIVAKLSKQQLKDLFDRFTVNFTYESNALEGNSLTLKDVAIVIFENQIPKGKDVREIYETINSRNVIELILKKKFRAQEKDIIKMHKMLVKDMGIAIGYKKIPNFVLGRDIQTAPPEKVPEEMKALLSFYEKNSEKMHPLKLAARIHGLFEKIHPFDDGNGRVGRFLINVILASKGYPPLIIRKSQRQAYFKYLSDFDNGYTANLERFLLNKYKTTYKKFFQIYVKYLK